MELHRDLRECPGHWTRRPRGPRIEWRCSACGATHSAEDQAARAAIHREYEMEVLLFRLVAEGRQLRA